MSLEETYGLFNFINLEFGIILIVAAIIAWFNNDYFVARGLLISIATMSIVSNLYLRIRIKQNKLKKEESK